MNTGSRKGYVLIMLSFLIAVCVSLGMVSDAAVSFFGRDSAREVRRERAYYYAVAGMRYADLLTSQRPDLISSGTTYTVRGDELGEAGPFSTWLQMGTMQLLVTIRGNSDGTFNVRSDCIY